MSEDGFLSRWSRRKQQLREGAPLPAEPPASQPAPPTVARAAPAVAAPAAPAVPAEPPPSMDDVQALTPESDFSRFTAPGVDPGVRNAAMKKLFADPHFNVMDRLDVYIDDYSLPDPMPLAMVRQLAGAQFLKLFDEPEEDKAKARAQGREVEDRAASPPVAQSGTAEAAAPADPTESHADPDLRLQQDDAPGPESPGAGAR